MSREMKEQIEIMARLESVEEQARKLQSALDAVEGQLSALDEEINHHVNVFESERTLIEDLKKDYRNHESDSKLTLSQISKSKEKLRSVKTNKEYQSTLKEIEDLNSKNSEIEDKMIEELEKIDDAENLYQERKIKLDELKEEIESKKKDIQEDEQEKLKLLADLMAEKSSISESIKPELMTILEKTKKIVDASAVAAVVKSVCQGCNMNIPAQLYNELHRFDEIKHCPWCSRIIYCKNIEEE